MDIREVRKARLQLAISKFDSAADFARAHGLEPSYLSQITTGHRMMGEKAARKLERAINKPAGWLDEGHSDTPAEHEAPEVDSPQLQSLIGRLRRAEADGRLSSKLASLIADMIDTVAPPSSSQNRKNSQPGGVLKKHTTEEAHATVDIETNREQFANQASVEIAKIRRSSRKPANAAGTITPPKQKRQ